MFKRYYLAYGSNLNLEQMNYRCNEVKVIGAYNLEGYRLVYKGIKDNLSYLTIEKYPDSFVPLGIYEVSYADIKSLDQYEGFPSLYSKCYIPFVIDNKRYKGLIYVMNDNYDYFIPSSEYVSICMEGYNDFDFSKEILAKAYDDTMEIISCKKLRLSLK